MLTLLLAAALFAQTGEAPAVSEDAKKLLETIDAIQSQGPIEDFRCEYEGNTRAMGPVAKAFKVKDGELVDQFSGTHIQNRAGDIRDESYHRRPWAYQNKISLTTFVVRKSEGRAKQYERLNDGSIGHVENKTAEEFSKDVVDEFSKFLPLEHMRCFIVDPQFACTVVDGQLDSRPVKIVTVSLRRFQDKPLFRYDVDLGRGGHVIRLTVLMNAGGGNAFSSRSNIKLAAFQVDGKEVWMPVAVETYGHGVTELGKPPRIYTTKKPTTHETIKIVDGTMAFNTHPGREIFTIDGKLGAPVSERLRKMSAEFATQKPGMPSTNAESAIAEVPPPNRPLVADLSSERNNWLKWLPLVGVVAVGTSLFALWRQRRRS
jgi:hypothetical protein